MNKRSAVFHRLVLVLAAVAVFGAAAWTAMQLFQEVPAPFVPPPKAHVRFNPRSDVRNNPLFSTLQAVLRGTVEPGVLGRPNPFVGPAGTAGVLAPGQSSGLGSVEEIWLGGGQAIAISKAMDGAMLVLIGGKNQGGGESFEVRRYGTDGQATTVGQWDLSTTSQGPTPDGLAPVALQQDDQGKLWFLSKSGSVGYLQPGGAPLWGASPIFLGANPQTIASMADIALDGTGRLWLTDQQQVFVGDGTTFQPVDIKAQLDDASIASLDALASAPGVTEELLDTAVQPRRLQTLVDGRMGLVTPLFGILFPITQGRAETLNGLSSATSVSVGLSGTGELWGLSLDRSGYVRRSAGKTLVFSDFVVLPKQAADNPLQMTAVDGSMVALDYTPASTVLWKTIGDEWVAQVMAASGTQPNDTIDRIEIDGAGNVWAILAQRGLLLVKPARSE